MIKITSATTKEAALIEEIAAPIWQEHYTPIIGSDQVEYMLRKFQSAAAIKAQMTAGYHYLIVYCDNQPAGYMAVEKRDRSLFISKFYLNANFRGRGIARNMLAKIDELAQKENCQQLELTVNKFNPAYDIYLKLGFENVEAIQIDIGNGYIMDDYRMVKNLST